MRTVTAAHRHTGWALIAALVAVLGALPAVVQAQAARFAGVIQLHVDVSDVERRIFRVSETIPAHAGKLELYYPQWLPGNHGPRGTIEQLAGLRFRINDHEIPWQRDPLDVYKFTLTLPPDTAQVTAEFQVATPQAADQGRIVVTANMLGLQWNQVVLYPAGYLVGKIPVQATLQLPAGWKSATALRVDPQRRNGKANQIDFSAVSLEQLVDSPVFAGRNLKQIDLTPEGSPPVMLNVLAEDMADLVTTDAQLGIHRALVRELYAALGPPHFDHYDLLLALSDNFGGIGLEHHRSSENSQSPAYFTSWDEDVDSHDLLAHEFTHSWNGKYRRPARLWTPHFNTPMQDDLLWVYEGMTQYYGMVVAARSGLWPQDFAREVWAATAAVFDGKRPGRDWRSLEDTTHQPIITPRRPLSWVSWQRTEDYYSESALLWFDVDTRLREMTKGQRSLDDFAHAFLAAPATQGDVSTYEFADIVRALNSIAPGDWNEFLHARVGGIHQPLPGGLERAGFRLVYSDQPNKAISDVEKSQHRTDLSYSIGMVISKDAALTDVVWNGPAFAAGLTTHTTLIAINGRAYSAELLKGAITQAAKGGPPVELIVRNQDRFRTVTIDYRGGLRYPHLQPIEGKADGMATLFAPRAPK
jgi:predicted metalloprotease with PDZ domain